MDCSYLPQQFLDRKNLLQYLNDFGFTGGEFTDTFAATFRREAVHL